MNYYSYIIARKTPITFILHAVKFALTMENYFSVI